MVKKKSDSDSFSLGVVFDIVKGLLSTIIFDQAKSWIQERISEIQKSLYNTTKIILESILAMTILTLGIVIILISLPFLLSYYLNLPASLFFVFFGLIMIIISLISFSVINKNKYNDE